MCVGNLVICYKIYPYLLLDKSLFNNVKISQTTLENKGVPSIKLRMYCKYTRIYTKINKDILCVSITYFPKINIYLIPNKDVSGPK